MTYVELLNKEIELDSFARTLELVMQLRPDRIADYGYAHMPQLFKPQRSTTSCAPRSFNG